MSQSQFFLLERIENVGLSTVFLCGIVKKLFHGTKVIHINENAYLKKMKVVREIKKKKQMANNKIKTMSSRFWFIVLHLEMNDRRVIDRVYQTSFFASSFLFHRMGAKKLADFFIVRTLFYRSLVVKQNNTIEYNITST